MKTPLFLLTKQSLIQSYFFFFFHHAACALNFLCFNFFISSSPFLFFFTSFACESFFSLLLHHFHIPMDPLLQWPQFQSGMSISSGMTVRYRSTFGTLQSTGTENSNCSGQKETRFKTCIHIEILELITRTLILGQKKFWMRCSKPTYTQHL